MNQGPYGPTPPPFDPNQGGGPPQGGGFGPSGYGPPPSAYGPPASDDQMAWISIALGSLGWVSCCCGPIPFIGLIGALGGFLLSIGAIVAGYMALQKAKQQNTRTDLAMIGLILGGTRVGLGVLGIVILVVLMIAGVGIGVLEGITHPH